MSTLTPNMNLPESTIGTDTGLQWEQNLNSSLTLIDSHNHASGSGVQIQPNGLNINTDLTINSNSLTTVKSILFTNQTSLSTLNSLYTIAGELWYNDPTQAVQITSGGAVNATSSGISSGTATASFSAGVLVVNAAAATPANVQGASFLFGNNLASSKYLTLSPPNAMAANYTLVLPSIPASTKFLTLDTSGNIGTASTISAAQIASLSITGSQMANGTVTTTQIASATILGSNIASSTIAGANIAGGTITEANITAGTLTGASLTSNINLSGKASQVVSKNIAVANTNATNGLAIIAIGFTSTGSVSFGEGATVTANGSGLYTVAYSTAFGATAAFSIGGKGGQSTYNMLSQSSSGVQFQFSDSTDRDFNLLVIGQRA